MSPIKSQILGLLLGFSTAIGCIFYEKIVKTFSYTTFMMVWLFEGLCFTVIFFFVFDNSTSRVVEDWKVIFNTPKYLFYVIGYAICGLTSPLWYKITSLQSVMAGSIYEVKYIVMLALIYIMFGDNKFTWNTAIGVSFAVGSIYFISKN